MDAPLFIKRKTKSDLTKQEWQDIQQPLNEKGRVNEEFVNLYGTRKNPYIGTERDSKERRNLIKRTIDYKMEDAYKKRDGVELERLNKIKYNLKNL